MQHLIAIVLAAALTMAGGTTRAGAAEPGLDEVLSAWLAATSEIQVFEAEFDRFVYDEVFCIVKRGVGDVRLELPDQGRLVVRAANVRAGKTLRMSDTCFVAKPDYSEIWEWTGEACTQTDPTSGQYQRFVLAEHEPGSLFDFSRFSRCIPAQLGVDAKRFQQECDFELREVTDDRIRLTGRPHADAELAKDFQTIDVLLDAATYLPHAVRTTDPSGNLQTVYVYSSVVATPVGVARPGSRISPEAP